MVAGTDLTLVGLVELAKAKLAISQLTAEI
jgi:hypothetical protein